MKMMSMVDTAVYSFKKSSVGSIVKNSVIVSCAMAAAKIFGFGEKIAAAKFLGTSETADTYFATTAVILSLVFIVKELIYPTLMGTLTQYGHSWAVFNKVFLRTAIVLAVCAAGMAIFNEKFCSVFLPGFSEDRSKLAAGLFRKLSPAVLFMGLSFVTYTALNARKMFLRTAVSEAGYKFLIMAGMFVFLPLAGISSVAYLFVIGAVLLLLVHLYFLKTGEVLFDGCGDEVCGQAMRKMGAMMRPLFLGVIFSHISGLFDNVLASTLEGGQIAYLGYSKKVIDALILVGPAAVMTVIFSELSHLKAAGDMQKFKKLLVVVCLGCVSVSIAATFLLVGFRVEIIRAMFERGMFDAESTVMTSKAFMIYSMGFLTFGLEILFVHSYYALGETRTVVGLGIIFVVVDIILAVVLMRKFEYLGIAGAFVISKTLKVFFLGICLSGRLRRVENV